MKRRAVVLLIPIVATTQETQADMNPFPPIIYIARRNRGGSFFTMLVFVMMLVSTALMYYYFQRTRSLERELSALQNGEVAQSVQESGFMSLLGLDDKKVAPLPAAPPIPVKTPALEQPAAPIEHDLPPSGAASTPTPKPGVSIGVQTEPPPFKDATTQALNLQADVAPVEQEVDVPVEESENLAVPADMQPEEGGDLQNLDSLYDAQPPVRVRAPQRNNR